MVKKEFTDQRPKENNDKSDIELIELLDRGTLGTGERDSVKAILDVRAKESTEKLNKSIEKLDKNTRRYSWALLCLTMLLFIVALFQIIVSLDMVPKTKWAGPVFMGLLLLVIFISGKKMLKEIKK